VLKRIDDPLSILAYCRYVAANAAEALSTSFRSEGARIFLFHFDPSHISLGLVVFKGDLEVPVKTGTSGWYPWGDGPAGSCVGSV
jgi:hypothetical protein